MNLSKIFSVMLALASGIALMGTAVVGYLVFVEPPWLSYTQLPFHVMTKQVQSGQGVLLTVLRCNTDTRTRVYIVSHVLMPEDKVHMRAVMLPATAASVTPGCSEILTAVNVVPPGTPPGRYHVEGFAEINGTIKTFAVSYSSEAFSVVP